jgi:hypothetical protein
VTLPTGLRYRVEQEARGKIEHFTSSDWRLTISLLVPNCLGADAWRTKERFEEETKVDFEEKVVEGVRVWIGRGDPRRPEGRYKVLGAVTFPDSGCATFIVVSTRTEDAAVIDSIVHSFHPKTRGGSDVHIH